MTAMRQECLPFSLPALLLVLVLLFAHLPLLVQTGDVVDDVVSSETTRGLDFCGEEISAANETLLHSYFPL